MGQEERNASYRMGMLGFDIETTGLMHEIPTAEISVVCTIEADGMHQTVYNFMAADDEGKVRLREELLRAFGRAERLCAYNAVLFDIPFMQKQLQIPAEVVDEWLGKLCDPFHCVKTCFDFTCKLDKMLALNGLECKSASGLEAVAMAKNGDWQRLEEYCMDDVRLTVQLCQIEKIALFQHADGFWVYCTYMPRLRIWTENTPPAGWTPPQQPQQAVSGLGRRLHEGERWVEELADFVNVCNGI